MQGHTGFEEITELLPEWIKYTFRSGHRQWSFLSGSLILEALAPLTVIGGFHDDHLAT